MSSIDAQPLGGGIKIGPEKVEFAPTFRATADLAVEDLAPGLEEIGHSLRGLHRRETPSSDGCHVALASHVAHPQRERQSDPHGSPRREKQRWFERGASAIALVSEGEVDGYVCPLCRRIFTDVGDLTFEHAPPASFGGKEVALTCDPCNSGSGHTLDAAMGQAEDLLDWGAGTLKKRIRARLTVQGVTVNVETEREDGGAFTILGLPNRNDPAVTAVHRAALDAMVELPADEQRFTVTFPRHKHVPSNVQAGWLRAAYVAAFARFGYRYALRPLMELVRAQIAAPTGNHLDRFISTEARLHLTAA